MIWEEAINVLRSHDLCFVTNDGGFFDAEGSGNGLHPCLAAEADAATHGLVVQRNMDALREDFRAEFAGILYRCQSVVGVRPVCGQFCATSAHGGQVRQDTFSTLALYSKTRLPNLLN